MSVVDVGKRQSESFTVSCFASGSNEIDVVLKNDLINGDSQDWLVGISDLSVPLDSTTYLDENHGQLLELHRLRHNTDLNNGNTMLVNQTVTGYPGVATDMTGSGNANLDTWTQDHVGRLRHDRGAGTTEFGNLMEHFNTWAGQINAQIRHRGLDQTDANGNVVGPFFNRGLVNNAAGYVWDTTTLGNTPLDQKKLVFRHIMVRISPSGNLEIVGSKFFWSAFFIKVSPYFQALTGFPEILSIDLVANPVAVRTSIVGGGGNAMVAVTQYAIANDDWMPTHAIISDRSFWGSADTRLSISLSTDLPIQRSLTLTDGIEERDYTLGSFSLSNEVTVSNTVSDQFLTEFTFNMESRAGHVQLKPPGPPTHWISLKPSDHTRVLRLRLNIRERVWHEGTKHWSIIHRRLPINAWQTWNTRLIFAKKTH